MVPGMTLSFVTFVMCHVPTRAMHEKRGPRLEVSFCSSFVLMAFAF